MEKERVKEFLFLHVLFLLHKSPTSGKTMHTEVISEPYGKEGPVKILWNDKNK